jgi:hypothetical protein
MVRCHDGEVARGKGGFDEVEPIALFILQFLWFLFAWSLIALHPVPWSAALSPDARLCAWVAPEMFRVLGVGLLVPGLSRPLSRGVLHPSDSRSQRSWLTGVAGSPNVLFSPRSQETILASESSTPDRRDRIIKTAQELAIRHRDSVYQLGGKTTTAMDCSYFVYLVFHEVFPEFQYMSSELIAASPAVFKESATPRNGDVIFFPKGQVPYEVKKGNKREYPNHVGIVLDAMNWVGRQTSSLGLVTHVNPWWGSRPKRYYSHVRFDAALSANAAAVVRSLTP